MTEEQLEAILEYMAAVNEFIHVVTPNERTSYHLMEVVACRRKLADMCRNEDAGIHNNLWVYLAGGGFKDAEKKDAAPEVLDLRGLRALYGRLRGSPLVSFFRRTPPI